MQSSKFIVFKGLPVELHKNDKGFWVDSYGTEYAFTESSTSLDPNDVCGVGIFSLSGENPLNAACKPHDYIYQCPVYQAYHTREEADYYLQELTKEVPGYAHTITPALFYFLSRALGGRLWENLQTNN